MERFIALGKNGKVDEVYNVEGKDVNYIINKTGAPLVELDSNRILVGVGDVCRFTESTDELSYLAGVAENVFAIWGKFGHYGDVAQMTRLDIAVGNINVGSKYVVDYVGRLAFPKGVLAVDLVPFFIDKNGHEFFVGITLGKEGPNYDKPALIGGHIDHKEGYFESAAEAIIHEAEEEAGIILCPQEEIGENPIPRAFEVELDLGGKKIETHLSYVGTFRTSENKPKNENAEKDTLLKNKRVDWTIAYQMVTEVDFELSEEVLRRLFKAGSDAKDLLIVPAGSEDPIPEFVHSHHRKIYLKAREKKDAIVRAWHGIPS